MPKTTETRFTVDISTQTHGAGDMGALLDMLRYEGGRVVSWSPGSKTFTVTIVVPSFRYTPERWHSFGIRPFNVEVI